MKKHNKILPADVLINTTLFRMHWHHVIFDLFLVAWSEFFSYRKLLLLKHSKYPALPLIQAPGMDAAVSKPRTTRRKASIDILSITCAEPVEASEAKSNSVSCHDDSLSA